jgi:hypothetical protein
LRQRTGSDAPQSAQNRFPGALSAPHVGQRISPPWITHRAHRAAPGWWRRAARGLLPPGGLAQRDTTCGSSVGGPPAETVDRRRRHVSQLPRTEPQTQSHPRRKADLGLRPRGWQSASSRCLRVIPLGGIVARCGDPEFC